MSNSMTPTGGADESLAEAADGEPCTAEVGSAVAGCEASDGLAAWLPEAVA